MRICSKHTDPDLRRRANQLLREAGCDVYDPTVDRDDYRDTIIESYLLSVDQRRIHVISILVVLSLVALFAFLSYQQEEERLENMRPHPAVSAPMTRDGQGMNEGHQLQQLVASPVLPGALKIDPD